MRRVSAIFQAHFGPSGAPRVVSGNIMLSTTEVGSLEARTPAMALRTPSDFRLRLDSGSGASAERMAAKSPIKRDEMISTHRYVAELDLDGSVDEVGVLCPCCKRRVAALGGSYHEHIIECVRKEKGAESKLGYRRSELERKIKLIRSAVSHMDLRSRIGISESLRRMSHEDNPWTSVVSATGSVTDSQVQIDNYVLKLLYGPHSAGKTFVAEKKRGKSNAEYKAGTELKTMKRRKRARSRSAKRSAKTPVKRKACKSIKSSTARSSKWVEFLN